MKKLFTILLALISAICAMAQQEEFKFEVTVAAGQTFYIPLSGSGDSGKPYKWTITWENGGAAQNANGNGTSAGIGHLYAAAGTYEITIKPNGGDDRWLAAFGFYSGSSGANAHTNKDLVTKVISPITPLMTRTQAEINSNTTTPPDYEWAYTFYGCTNLTMGAAFTFSDAWNSITRVGNYFAKNMFDGCSGAAFNMNTVFNLPQNITTVGNYFVAWMFASCKGAAFKMNDVFNLPQNITTVGIYFADDMFFRCSGAAFKMNDVFNLPQNITTVGDYFAYSMFPDCNGAAFTMGDNFNLPQNITTVGTGFACGMFYGCSGATFKMNDVFNLPQNITTVGNNFAHGLFNNCSGTAFQVNNVFKFPRLTQTEINTKNDVFYKTFNNLGTATTQTRTAASIINGNPTPNNNRETFTSSDCFADRPYIPVNWGGNDATPPTFTVTYNYNGATGENTTPSKTVTYNNNYGPLPAPTKELTVTYDYNGSSQANNSETYTGIFGGWYLENTFVNVVTSTTIVTTFSNHNIYAKWNGTPLILPTPNERTGYAYAGWYSEAACVNLVGYAGANYTPTANTTLYARWVQTSGIDDIFSNSISIYPNPVKEELFITSENRIEKIEICDIAGRTVETQNFASLQRNTTINLSSLPQGVYLVKVYTDKGVVTQKIVKN